MDQKEKIILDLMHDENYVPMKAKEIALIKMNIKILD